jgi:excisionase family DNA binding protein
MMKNSSAVAIDHSAQTHSGLTVSASAVSHFLHVNDDFWTTDETARYLRCEAQTIRKALSSKGSFWGLKPRRFGRRWLFRAAEVRALVEEA